MTEWRRDDYRITDQRDDVDLDVVHGFLTASYWARGIPRETVRRSVEHSLSFSVFRGSEQVGFARVITDYATFAYLADVFVLESHRSAGLGKWLIEIIMAHPALQGLRRWMLATRDAHGLYAKFGFVPTKHPERFMEKHDPDIYKR